MKRIITITLLSILCTSSFAKDLRIGVIGDPQVRHERDFEMARNSIYKELLSRKDCDLMIILGDLVNECPRLIQPSCDILDSLKCPWVRVQGNHDGPHHVPDSTFVLDGIRFILMDNNIESGTFTDSQIAWLDSVVSNSKEKNFILAAHRPYSGLKCRQKTDPILKKCPNLLILVAHTHSQKRHQLWPGVQEIIASTTSGTWWRGDKDEHGIPISMQKDGAPRGYFIADIDPSDFSLRLQYKCVGRSDKDVASLYSDGKALYVNVYGGHMDGHLEAEIDGKWVTLKCDGNVQAPEAELEVRKSEGISKEKRNRNIAYIPIDRTGSPHVWTIKTREPLTGEIRIRYNDPNMAFERKLKIKKL